MFLKKLGGPICQNVNISYGKPLIWDLKRYTLGGPILQKVNISQGKPMIFTMALYAVGRPIRQNFHLDRQGLAESTSGIHRETLTLISWLHAFLKKSKQQYVIH